MEQFEPIHRQILAPTEANPRRTPQITPGEEYLQFRIGDIPREVDDARPLAPHPRQVIVVNSLLPHPIVPRTLVEIEGKVTREGGIQRDGTGHAQGRESQVHHVVAPQVLRHVHPYVEMEGREGILPRRLVYGERRPVGFDAAPALPSGFPAAGAGSLFVGRLPPEEAGDETEQGGVGLSHQGRRRRRRRGCGGGHGREIQAADKTMEQRAERPASAMRRVKEKDMRV